MHYCAYCKTPITPGATRCPRCNRKVETEQANVPSTPFRQLVPTTPYPSVSLQQTHETQTPGIATLTKPPQRAPRWVVVTVVLMALLLMLSGVSLLYYTGVTRPALIRAQVTATMQSYATTVAQATSIARMQATASTVAQNQTTATANAQVTAQVQATMLAQQNLYAQSTRGKPTINTALKIDNGLNWDVYPTKDGGGCAFTANAYHSSVFQKNFYVPCITHSTSYQNFALDIQMRILQGNEGGVIFRADAMNKNFYSFRISTNGTYTLVQTRDDGHITPLVYDKSNFIKTGLGQSNTLSLIARGNNFYLYINHQYVGSASDNSYITGRIGFMAIDLQNGTDVAFNNLRVWRL